MTGRALPQAADCTLCDRIFVNQRGLSLHMRWSHAVDARRHGTYAAWNQHRREGSPTCEPCKAANTAYMRRYRRAKGITSAHLRAVEKLVASHPEEFAGLLAREEVMP